MNFKKITFVIAAHEAFASGISHDLKKYLLLNKAGKLLFISHPLTYQKAYYKNSSRFEFFINSKMVYSKIAFHWVLPDFFLYIKDFLYTQFWCTKIGKKIDVFFGFDPLNAFSGIFLKKFGFVEKVVYYSIDYFPIRFKNRIMNSAYHFLDKICVKYSDETWNLSPTMVEAREKLNNMTREKYPRQYTVPVCVWFQRTRRKTFKLINKRKLVYVGLVDDNAGVDLIVRSLPKIIKKMPNVFLEIIGSGPAEEYLKTLAKKLKVSENIIFHGLVAERERVESVLSDGAAGLATFNPKLFGTEVKNADPMKIKDYMLFGMPVIATDCIATAEAIAKAKCGMIIGFNEDQLIKVVLKILKNKELLRKYRQNAIKYVSKFDIEKTYDNNIKRLLGL